MTPTITFKDLRVGDRFKISGLPSNNKIFKKILGTKEEPYRARRNTGYIVFFLPETKVEKL